MESVNWITVAVLVLAASFALLVAALVSLFRHARDGLLSNLETLGWAALILLVTVIGPIVWLTIGSRTARNSMRES
jgi:hypothetical protein